MNNQEDFNNFVNNAAALMVMMMFGSFGMTSMSAPVLMQTAPEEAARSRYNELKPYCHTINDIEAIAERRGIVKMYHGTPTEFTEMFVEYGPKVPYKAENTARYVAHLYNIPWIEFQDVVHRTHEVIERLSTAPVFVAARWAWSFPLGEILTDFNSHARMFVAAKQLSRKTGYSFDDANDSLHELAQKLAKTKKNAPRYTFESAPDILELPDRLALKSKTGAIVQLGIDARAIPDNIIHSAQSSVKYCRTGEVSLAETEAYWNVSYTDARIPINSIRSAKVIARGLKPWEEDLVEDLIRKDLEQNLVAEGVR